MKTESKVGATTILSDTRTNKDWVMIFSGVALVIFFALVVYFSVDFKSKGQDRKPKGPIKDPHGAVKPEGSLRTPLQKLIAAL